MQSLSFVDQVPNAFPYSHDGLSGTHIFFTLFHLSEEIRKILMQSCWIIYIGINILDEISYSFFVEIEQKRSHHFRKSRHQGENIANA